MCNLFNTSILLRKYIFKCDVSNFIIRTIKKKIALYLLKFFCFLIIQIHKIYKRNKFLILNCSHICLLTYHT